MIVIRKIQMKINLMIVNRKIHIVKSVIYIAIFDKEHEKN